jgi:hypothetical protein
MPGAWHWDLPWGRPAANRPFEPASGRRIDQAGLPVKDAEQRTRNEQQAPCFAIDCEACLEEPSSFGADPHQVFAGFDRNLDRLLALQPWGQRTTVHLDQISHGSVQVPGRTFEDQ